VGLFGDGDGLGDQAAVQRRTDVKDCLVARLCCLRARYAHGQRVKVDAIVDHKDSLCKARALAKPVDAQRLDVDREDLGLVVLCKDCQLHATCNK